MEPKLKLTLKPALTDAERHELNERYNRAAHRVQTAVAFEQSTGTAGDSPKHLRVGLDLRAADALALAELLIAKGVFTGDELPAGHRQRDRTRGRRRGCTGAATHWAQRHDRLTRGKRPNHVSNN
jgi:hypothetical protein